MIKRSCVCKIILPVMILIIIPMLLVPAFAVQEFTIPDLISPTTGEKNAGKNFIFKCNWDDVDLTKIKFRKTSEFYITDTQNGNILLKDKFVPFGTTIKLKLNEGTYDITCPLKYPYSDYVESHVLTLSVTANELVFSNPPPTNPVIDLLIEPEKEKSNGGSTINPPPTIGLDNKGIRKVFDGLTINNFTSDADYFNTHYPMQYTEIGKQNHINVLVYENSGPTNLEILQFALVDEVGTSINESELRIEVWMDYFANDIENPKIKDLLLFDDNNLIDYLTVEVSLADCNIYDEIEILSCLSFDIYWTYKKSPTDTVILINPFDYQKSGFNYYFNDGWTVTDPNYTPEIMMQTEPEKECTDPIQKVMTRNNCNFRAEVPNLWKH